MRRPLLPFSLLAALGCGTATAPRSGPEAPPRAPASVLEEGAVRRADSPPRARGNAPREAPPLPAPSPVRARLARVEAPEGEDGAGHTIAATFAVALELESADGWPATAQPQSLEVGALRFYSLGHPSPTVLRVLVADGRALPRGAPVLLRYGDSAGRSRVLLPSLEVSY